MMYPRYFFNIVSPDGTPRLRIYKKASETSSLELVDQDMPISRADIAKFIHDLAEHL